MKKKKLTNCEIIRELAISKHFILAIIFGVIHTLITSILTIYKACKQTTYAINTIDGTFFYDKTFFEYSSEVVIAIAAFASSLFLYYSLYKVHLSFKNRENEAICLAKIPFIILINTLPIFLMIIYLAIRNTEGVGFALVIALFTCAFIALFLFIYYKAIKKTINYTLTLIDEKPKGKSSKLLRGITAASLFYLLWKFVAAFNWMSLLNIFAIASHALFLYLLLIFDNPDRLNKILSRLQ